MKGPRWQPAAVPVPEQDAQQEGGSVSAEALRRALMKLQSRGSSTLQHSAGAAQPWGHDHAAAANHHI
jgi:hypothetical protein